VVWFYLGKLIWPAGLTFIYPRWQIDATAWWLYLYLLAGLAVPIALWLLRGHLGKAPLVAALFSGATLAPALGFIDVYPMRFSFVADHFQYLASVGPIAAFAALLTIGLKLDRRAQPPGAGRGAAKPAFAAGTLGPAILLIVLGLLTWRQGQVYKNAETLWRDTLAKNPSAWIAHNNLGNLVKDQGKTEEALRHYHAALDLKPDYVDALNNLGALLVDQGRIDEAITRYREALRLWPGLIPVHFNLGKALAKQGQFDQAVAQFERILEINDQYVSAYNALGNTLVRTSRVDDGIERYRQALAVDPNYAEAHNGLAVALGMKDRVQEAIEHFQEAVRLKPDFPDALGGLGLALATIGKVDEAIVYWRRSLQLDPSNVTFRCLLADHLLGQGRAEEAGAEYRQVLRLDPANPDARRGLAAARTERNQE
jgi:tetratricopeptide (TPR) repeat protein